MIAEGINKILEISNPEIIEAGGREYSTKPLFHLPTPHPVPIEIHTLSGLLDFYKAESGKFDSPMFVVRSPLEVALVSARQGDENRHVYAVAKHEASGRFDQWTPFEDFIIKIQSLFLQDSETIRLLKIVGNISDENIKTMADDGVTQKVTVRTGLARVEDQAVANPFTLAPFRTFNEVAQPLSPFILRLNKSIAALFDADGGAWKLTAIEYIATYLRDELEGAAPVIA